MCPCVLNDYQEPRFFPMKCHQKKWFVDPGSQRCEKWVKYLRNGIIYQTI